MQYLSQDIPVERVSDIMLSVGLEVEKVTPFASIEGGLEGLVVGEVLSCEKHPNADRLKVTEVAVGDNEPLSIICGAPNVAIGEKVVVAPIGTTLYTGEKTFKITKSKIRGVYSYGMLCSEQEIGLGASHDGILLLPQETTVGTPLKEIFSVENDYTITVDITPNRIEGASHIGAARDIVAHLLGEEASSQLIIPNIEALPATATVNPISVEVADTIACPRYMGITLTGIQVEESPEWLKNRLLAVGLTPINNIVDITNFVLYETGQPLHAFDADKIKGGKVIVQKLPENTPFTTLDGKERKLHEDDLMICDGDGNPMCIAGVFGGENSGVSDQTTSIFIECAYFDPITVRKTAKRHTLNTDASFHYERGVDISNMDWVLNRVSTIIKDVCHTVSASETIDIYPTQIVPEKVSLEYSFVNRMAGVDIPPSAIKRILGALGFDIQSETKDALTLLIPLWYADVTRPIDVVEEVLRIYGLDKIPLNTSVSFTYEETPNKKGWLSQNIISEMLVGEGFFEIISNSLEPSSWSEGEGDYSLDYSVALQNPLSSELNVMRQTLLFGGLSSIAMNVQHQRPDLKLFEFGRCYSLSSKDSSNNALSRYLEVKRLGIWVTGQRYAPTWTDAPEMTSFFQLKAYIHNVLTRMGISLSQVQQVEVSSRTYRYKLVWKQDDIVIASAGLVSESIQRKLKLKNPVWYGEVEWEKLVRHALESNVSYTPIVKYPFVRRDLSLVVDDQVTFESLQHEALLLEKDRLKRVGLFDIYTKGLEKGKKSYALYFILQDHSKTMTDKEIDAVMGKIIKQYQEKFSAILR